MRAVLAVAAVVPILTTALPLVGAQNRRIRALDSRRPQTTAALPIVLGGFLIQREARTGPAIGAGDLNDVAWSGARKEAPGKAERGRADRDRRRSQGARTPMPAAPSGRGGHGR